MRKWTSNTKFYFAELEPQMDGAVYLSIIQPGEIIYESPTDEHDAIWVKNCWYSHDFSTVGWKTFCTDNGDLSGAEADDLWATSDLQTSSNDAARWRVDETAKTEDYTLETNELDGRLFSNQGASQSVEFQLPPCEDGYVFSAVVRTENGLSIAPDALESIVGLDDGEPTDSSTIGSAIVLRGNASGTWEVLTKYGTWSGIILGGGGGSTELVAHATQHVNGVDDIQLATNARKGLASAGHITAIEAATAHGLLTVSAHGGIVASGDPRLTDARTPTLHGSDKHSVAYDPAGTGHSEAASHVTAHEDGFNHALLHANVLIAHDHAGVYDPLGTGHAEASGHVKSHEDAFNHALLHSNSLDHANTLDHSNANDPTAEQKAALVGTSGLPGAGNRYVTESDARLTDARTPLTHNHDLLYDAIGLAHTEASGHVQAHVDAFNHALLHTQGTDQGLDTGGSNAVTAAQAKTAYTHSQVAHAPANAITPSGVTFENLNANGDIGAGADQVPPGNHTHPYQASDADLTAIAALGGTGTLERTGSDAWGLYTVTAAGKALASGLDAADQRNKLGLGTAALLDSGTDNGQVALSQYAMEVSRNTITNDGKSYVLIARNTYVQDANALLYSMFDGDDGSQVITDEPQKNTFACYNGAALTTIYNKFGGASLNLPGSDSRVTITPATPSTWDFGSAAPFTIEFWFRTACTDNNQVMFEVKIEEGKYVTFVINPTDGTWDFGIYVNQSDYALNPSFYIGTTSLTDGQWHHVALVRAQDGVPRFYMDGTRNAQTPINPITLNMGQGSWIIGDSEQEGTFCYTGQIDDLRVSNVARYSDATLTVPTTPFGTATGLYMISTKTLDTWPTPSNRAPLMNGVADEGIANVYAREDHAHPSDTAKLSLADLQEIAASGAVPKATPSGVLDLSWIPEHLLAGMQHTPDTIANLNSLLTDAFLTDRDDDAGVGDTDKHWSADKTHQHFIDVSNLTLGDSDVGKVVGVTESPYVSFTDTFTDFISTKWSIPSGCTDMFSYDQAGGYINMIGTAALGLQLAFSNYWDTPFTDGEIAIYISRFNTGAGGVIWEFLDDSERTVIKLKFSGDGFIYAWQGTDWEYLGNTFGDVSLYGWTKNSLSNFNWSAHTVGYNDDYRTLDINTASTNVTTVKFYGADTGAIACRMTSFSAIDTRSSAVGKMYAPLSKITIRDSDVVAPMSFTPRSAPPSAPLLNDIYLDDGSNTVQGNRSWKQYDGVDWHELAPSGVLSAPASTNVVLWDNDLSNSITLQTPASLAGDYYLTLPGTDGAANQSWKTDGNGVMSWTQFTEDSSGNLSLVSTSAKFQIGGTSVLGMESSNGMEIGLGTDANSKPHAIAIGSYSKAERYGELAISMDHQASTKFQKSEVFWCGSVAAAGTPAWTELFLHNVSNQRCLVLASTAIRVEIHISAMDTGGHYACYLVKALISRNGSNTTTLEWSSVTAEFEDIAAWDVRVTADDTNEALKLEVLSNDSDYDNFTASWSAVGYLTEVRT